MALGVVRPVQKRHPTQNVAAEQQYPGLTDALDAFFKRDYGQSYDAARTKPMKALTFFKQDKGIDESGVGPQTIAALRHYNSNFGYPAGTTAWSRFWAGLFGGRSDTREAPRVQTADYRRSMRDPAAGLVQPAAYRGPRTPVVTESDSGWTFASLFGGPRATPAPGTLAKLMHDTGNRPQPNHLYVVQIDQENNGSNVGSSKGRTSVFSTDARGVPSCLGTFSSSSQAFRGDPLAGVEASPSVLKKYASYRYAYMVPGTYPMTTTRVGAIGGFGINGDRIPAYRDVNKNGRIDADERRNPTTAGLIRWHSQSLGSAGCQTIVDNEWASFQKVILDWGRRHNGAPATYILERTRAGFWA